METGQGVLHVLIRFLVFAGGWLNVYITSGPGRCVRVHMDGRP